MKIKRASSGLAVAALCVGITGCYGERAPDEGENEADKVTFWRDVAPVFYDHCVACHMEGGIAPFRLDTYADAKQYAPLIGNAVVNKTMPPWLIRNDGSCGEFEHGNWLSDKEIQIVSEWAYGEQLEGLPSDDLSVEALPELNEATVYQTPSFLPEPDPAIGMADEYRCFMIDPGLEEDRFLTGYDIDPGESNAIHHALVMTVDTTARNSAGITALEQMQALDALSPDRAGWPCYGSAGADVPLKGAPITWGPGQGATQLPDGTGFRISKNDVLVAQMHYHLGHSGGHSHGHHVEEPMVHDIKLQLTEEVEREGFFFIEDEILATLGTGSPAVLMPGQNAVDFTWRLPFDRYSDIARGGAMEVFGILPHMHGRGSEYQANIIRADGSKECVGKIDSWDPGWQHYYYYKNPIPVYSSDSIEVTCTYDTSNDSNPVLPGLSSDDEMCYISMYIVPSEEGSPVATERAF